MIKRPIIMTGDDKERVLDCIAQIQGFDEALKLVAALKVTLLADHESPGHQGLTEPTRKRAWQASARGKWSTNSAKSCCEGARRNEQLQLPAVPRVCNEAGDEDLQPHRPAVPDVSRGFVSR
jgi:hypothetical protein